MPGPGAFEQMDDVGASAMLFTIRLSGDAIPAAGEACGIDFDERRIRIAPERFAPVRVDCADDGALAGPTAAATERYEQMEGVLR